MRLGVALYFSGLTLLAAAHVAQAQPFERDLPRMPQLPDLHSAPIDFPYEPIDFPPSSSVQLSAEQLHYNITTNAMQTIRINELCAALTRIHGSGEHECVNGELQIGDDLVIEVSETSREDNEFTALVVGRGMLLSGAGPYESHLLNIIFVHRFDGQPRIILFNSMPLYTTFDSLEMILSDRIREDVKYIPRSETETKLVPFHARVSTILRAMIDERVLHASNN